MNMEQKKTGSDCYNDFVGECNDFFERMNMKYRDIIGNDSQIMSIKRVERKNVAAFNNGDYITQHSTIGEVSIKFNVLA